MLHKGSTFKQAWELCRGMTMGKGNREALAQWIPGTSGSITFSYALLFNSNKPYYKQVHELANMWLHIIKNIKEAF